jgi:pimeloyl-ACP methyl ester carboxylesterase
MATYVLVHGAWGGAWCWSRVRRALQAGGQEVFTPTLSGLGERSHLNSRHVDLSTHVSDVTNLTQWEDLSDVVLCGHSYAGCVISGVADQIPERIRALVYLDAFVLEDGECLFDLIGPERARSMREQAQAYGDGWKVEPMPVSSSDLGAGGWILGKCTPQSIACFEERIRLRGVHGIADVTHVLVSHARNNSPRAACHQRAVSKGWRTRVMVCDYDIIHEQPEQLAAFLLEYASAVGNALPQSFSRSSHFFRDTEDISSPW